MADQTSNKANQPMAPNPAAAHEECPPTLVSIYKTTNDTADRLERLSRALLHHINRRDYENPAVQLLAPNFRYEDDEAPTASSRQEHLININELFKGSSEYSMDIKSSCSTVDEFRGTATVWVLLNMYSCPYMKNCEGLTRERMIEFEWRRKRDGWRCTREIGIRGQSGFT
jgi:hypothetical protein